jgi:hypothetical protein
MDRVFAGRAKQDILNEFDLIHFDQHPTQRIGLRGINA